MMAFWREFHTLIVLCSFLTFFALLTVAVVLLRPNDGQLYTLFAAAFGNVQGALTLYLTGRATAPPPAGSTTVTQVEQVTRTPEAK